MFLILFIRQILAPPNTQEPEDDASCLSSLQIMDIGQFGGIAGFLDLVLPGTAIEKQDRS